MNRKLWIIATVLIGWLPATSPSANAQVSSEHPIENDVENFRQRAEAALRFGWWAVSHEGSLNKVGEFQDLDSSAFWDVDSLTSDGTFTLDFFATGLDNDGNQVGLKYYGPSIKFDFGFQRYLRASDHDPLDNFNRNLGFGPGQFEQAPTFSPLPDDPNNPQFQGTRTAPGATNRALNSQDLNVGEDYAIRVEEMRGEVSGWLSEDLNLKYRVKAWAQRKFGERQTNAMAHCFNGGLADDGVPADHPFVPGSGGRSCHVLSRRQEIDWLTEEVVPSIEGKWGPVTIEYSHTIRAFYQHDQALTRYYTGAGNAAGTSTDEWRVLGFNVTPPAAGTNGTLADYASVPENLTQMGQLKLGIELSECRNLYAIALAGNTHNDYRETDREFYGLDLRLMDRSIEGFSTVGYAKVYSERNEFPGFIRYDELGPPRTRVGFATGNSPSDIVDPSIFQPPGTQNPLDPANPYIRWLNSGQFGFLRHPVDYTRTSAGIKTRWHPQCSSGMSILGGYDYTQLDRDHDIYEAFVPLDPANPDPDAKMKEEFGLGSTIYHTLHTAWLMQWTGQIDSYIEYTRRWIDNPLYAVHEPNGVTNSGLPTSEDLVQLGGSWYPCQDLMLSGWFGIENRSHSSDKADFEEDNYPLVTTVFYAPMPAWSLSLGYAFFSNWIDQDIILGDQIGGYQGAGPTGRIELVPITDRFNYGGRSHVVTLGTSYALTDCVHLLGGAEYVWGRNEFRSTQSVTGELGKLSEENVVTMRYTAGVDWRLHRNVSTYFRYVFFDYEDKEMDYNSGTTHMFLAGLTAIW